jgi:hypothetical protein
MTSDFLSSLPRLRGGWRVNTALQRTGCRCHGRCSCPKPIAPIDQNDSVRPAMAAGPTPHRCASLHVKE